MIITGEGFGFKFYYFSIEHNIIFELYKFNK